jgi:hypothetical protein
MKKPQFITNFYNSFRNYFANNKVTQDELEATTLEVLAVVNKVGEQAKANDSNIQKIRTDIGILARQSGFDNENYSNLISEMKEIKEELTRPQREKAEKKAKWAGRRESVKEYFTTYKPILTKNKKEELAEKIAFAYEASMFDEIEVVGVKGRLKNPKSEISFKVSNGSQKTYTKTIGDMNSRIDEKEQEWTNYLSGLKKMSEQSADIVEKMNDHMTNLAEEIQDPTTTKPIKTYKLSNRKKENLEDNISIYMKLDAKTDVEVTGIDGKLRKDDTTISHTITDKTGKTTDCYMTVGELKDLKAAYKAPSIDEVVEEKGPGKWDSFKENTGATYNTVKTSIGMFASDIKSGANSFGKYIGSKIANSAAKSVRNKNTKAKRQEAEYFAEVIGEHIDAKANDCIEILNVNNLSVTYNVNGMVNHKVQRVDLEDAASSLGQKQYVADLNKQRTRRQIGIYALGPLTGLIKK